MKTLAVITSMLEFMLVLIVGYQLNLEISRSHNYIKSIMTEMNRTYNALDDIIVDAKILSNECLLQTEKIGTAINTTNERVDNTLLLIREGDAMLIKRLTTLTNSFSDTTAQLDEQIIELENIIADNANLLAEDIELTNEELDKLIEDLNTFKALLKQNMTIFKLGRIREEL